MTQEFHLSVTPIGDNEYLVRTERVAPGVPLAEEQVTWSVDEWLTEAGFLMNDPLLGLLRGDSLSALPEPQQTGFDPLYPSSQPIANLVAFGQKLYNALFYGTIRDSWMTAQGIAQHRQEVLRLRLGLKDNRLPRLPWEVLHAGNRPLATGTDVVFSRYYSGATSIASPFQFQLPPDSDSSLKILMVLAAPTDQDVLALKQEALHLQEELQTNFRSGSRGGRFSDIQLTILEQPGREQLTQALEHNHYQVLHYAGHSNLGNSGGKLYLVSSKTGLTETLSGDDLAGLLVNNGIRMAVFNSCRGSYTATPETNGGDGAGNLAEALIRRGIPAVLAMAERIPDNVALNLSRLFYRNLKQAYAIDLSLNRARQGLISSYSSNQLYWALPILYLHPEFDGCLKPGTADPEMAEGLSPSEAVAVAPPGPTQALNGSSSSYIEALDEDSFDPEELELDKLDYHNDLAAVARLVNELSQAEPGTSEADPPSLPASPSESLLPETEVTPQPQDYLILPDNSRLTPVPRVKPSSTTTSPGLHTGAMEELERLLADTGKLTDAIAACNQAIRDNPTDARAYDQLGLALYQQGYLAEAIAAYQQALRVNPTLAEVHNHLGLVFYQQGNFSEAIEAYRQALHLNPYLKDAQHNLEVVLGQRQPPVESSQPASKNPPLYWLGAGTLGLVILGLGIWFAQAQFDRSALLSPLPGQTTSSSVDQSGDVKQVSTQVVTALATDQLNRRDVAGATRSIEALLERGALREATVVMTPALSREGGNPALTFLMGRLAWQSVRAGDSNFSIDDARRYWETSVKAQPAVATLTSLGFAHYEEGDPTAASRSWLQAVKLAGSTPESEKITLNAYAGLALVAMQAADRQPPTKRAELVMEATKLRQKVLTADPVNFQADALGQNWLWSEKAVRDWRTLLRLN